MTWSCHADRGWPPAPGGDRRLALVLGVLAGCAPAPAPPVTVDLLTTPPPPRAAASTGSAAGSAPLRIELRTSNLREVPSRFLGIEDDMAQAFVIDVATQPPQRLVMGDVRQTVCSVRSPRAPSRRPRSADRVLLACDTDAVHFEVTFARLADGMVELTATETFQATRQELHSWSVGRLHIPPGRPVHVSLIDEEGTVGSERTHAAGF